MTGLLRSECSHLGAGRLAVRVSSFPLPFMFLGAVNLKPCRAHTNWTTALRRALWLLMFLGSERSDEVWMQVSNTCPCNLTDPPTLPSPFSSYFHLFVFHSPSITCSKDEAEGFPFCQQMPLKDALVLSLADYKAKRKLTHAERVRVRHAGSDLHLTVGASGAGLAGFRSSELLGKRSRSTGPAQCVSLGAAPLHRTLTSAALGARRTQAVRAQKEEAAVAVALRVSFGRARGQRGDTRRALGAGTADAVSPIFR